MREKQITSLSRRGGKALITVDRYFLAIHDKLIHDKLINSDISAWSADELETLWRAKFGHVCQLFLPEDVLEACAFGRPAYPNWSGDDAFWLGVSLRLFYEKKLTRDVTRELMEDRVHIRFTINEGT
jgi:hypothetical protein